MCDDPYLTPYPFSGGCVTLINYIMNKIINLGKLFVASKSTIDTTNSLGVKRTFHNLTVLNEDRTEGDVVSISKDVYDKLEVNKMYDFSYFERQVQEYTFKEWIVS